MKSACRVNIYKQTASAKSARLDITPRKRARPSASRARREPCNRTKVRPSASRALTDGTKAKSVSNIASLARVRERTRRDANYKAA